MSLTVVGSIALDSVRTPFGERERMLGGSAVHFALAASFFAEVHVVGPVGHDFPEEHVELLRSRGVNVDDLERVSGGETFRWRGHYEIDMNLAHTDATELGVFADFEPKLSAASSQADVLFLGNIQPDLQRRVRRQCTPRLAALDSMNLWIDTARKSLLAAISEVDCVLLNDSEVRMLTQEPSLARAARKLMDLGPRIVIAKRGEYGAVMFTPERSFALPAYLLEEVRDPTGAGDSFAGGFLGYLDMQGTDPSDDALHRAIAYGTVLASFNVEEFGIERVASLSEKEIGERYDALRAMTHFELPR